jgi:hypothetical protein
MKDWRSSLEPQETGPCLYAMPSLGPRVSKQKSWVYLYARFLSSLEAEEFPIIGWRYIEMVFLWPDLVHTGIRASYRIRPVSSFSSSWVSELSKGSTI